VSATIVFDTTLSVQKLSYILSDTDERYIGVDYNVDEFPAIPWAIRIEILG